MWLPYDGLYFWWLLISFSLQKLDDFSTIQHCFILIFNQDPRGPSQRTDLQTDPRSLWPLPSMLRRWHF